MGEHSPSEEVLADERWGEHGRAKLEKITPTMRGDSRREGREEIRGTNVSIWEKKAEVTLSAKNTTQECSRTESNPVERGDEGESKQ